MAMEMQQNTASVSQAKGVEVDRIEKELAAMWSGVSDSGDKSGPGVTRACTLNLIVCVTPAVDQERMEEMLADVNDRHPGRALILVADRATLEPRLDAWISMRCRLLGGTGKQICGEQVTIEAGGPLVDTAASAVAPLLVPDVPVYLWWNDIPHGEDKLFDHLTRLADRVIIDSAMFNRPRDDLLRLAAMVGEPSSRLRVSDLNWGRLTPWRALLASFWDVPDYRPLLDRIDRVTISCHPPAGASGQIAPEALLFAGWLASRLGWGADGSGPGDSVGAGFHRLRAGGRTITLTMQHDTTVGGADGGITSVALSTSDGDATFSAALSSDHARLTTEARVGAARTLGRIRAHESTSDTDRLCRELAFLRHDAVYEAALDHAARLLR